MLKFDNVSMRYPEVGEVLRNVSFELEKGEIAFLTGHSGAGKSTLFKLIAMMEDKKNRNCADKLFLIITI